MKHVLRSSSFVWFQIISDTKYHKWCRGSNFSFASKDRGNYHARVYLSCIQHKNLTPIGLRWFISNDLEDTHLGSSKQILVSNQLKVIITFALNIVSWLLCWRMNVTLVSHNPLSPMSKVQSALTYAIRLLLQIGCLFIHANYLGSKSKHKNL